MICFQIDSYDDAIKYRNKQRRITPPVYDERRVSEQPIPNINPSEQQSQPSTSTTSMTDTHKNDSANNNIGEMSTDEFSNSEDEVEIEDSNDTLSSKKQSEPSTSTANMTDAHENDSANNDIAEMPIDESSNIEDEEEIEDSNYAFSSKQQQQPSTSTTNNTEAQGNDFGDDAAVERSIHGPDGIDEEEMEGLIDVLPSNTQDDQLDDPLALDVQPKVEPINNDILLHEIDDELNDDTANTHYENIGDGELMIYYENMASFNPKTITVYVNVKQNDELSGKVPFKEYVSIFRK